MNTTFKIVVLVPYFSGHLKFSVPTDVQVPPTSMPPAGKIDNILPPVGLEQSVPVLIV